MFMLEWITMGPAFALATSFFSMYRENETAYDTAFVFFVLEAAHQRLMFMPSSGRPIRHRRVDVPGRVSQMTVEQLRMHTFPQLTTVPAI